MNKKYFFHIGLPKSATSYLQKNFYPLLELDYIGKHYDSDIDYKTNSKEIEAVLKKIFIKQPYNINEEYLLEIHSLLKNKNKILYSNEELVGSYTESFRNNYQIVHNLNKVFPNSKIIFVIRKQDDFIESLYKQSIRNGTWISIKKFIGYKKGNFNDYRMGYNKDHISLESLNYFNLIKFYEEEFGKENLLVLPYERLKNEKNIFLNDLCDFLDVDFKEPLSNKSANLSDNYPLLQVMRFFNFFIYKKNQNTLNKVFHFNLIGKLINKIPLKRNYLDKAVKYEINKYFQDSNKKVSEEYNLELKKYGYYN